MNRRTFLHGNCLITASAVGLLPGVASAATASLAGARSGGATVGLEGARSGGSTADLEGAGSGGSRGGLKGAHPGGGRTTPGQARTPEQRLRELGIELPPAPQPVAVYVTSVVTGNLLFTSGHGPAQLPGVPAAGKVGADLTLEEGYQAARATGLAVLATVRNTLGSLDRVVRLVKTLGMVNCTTDFTQQPQVVNGFSELMVEVFGDEMGKGGRSAVGMGSLPSNIPCEIEAIFEVRA